MFYFSFAHYQLGLKPPRDVTYQDDGPRQESTENDDVLPLVENDNFPGLW